MIGYNSLAAQGLHRKLLDAGERGWSIHSRVLGNILYLMASQITSKKTLRGIEDLILQSIK